MYIKGITGDYTLYADPNWLQFALQDVYLECDTTLAPVNIKLPSISSMGGFLNVRIYVSDSSNNASSHNITVDSIDTIDGADNTIISQNGGSCLVYPVSKDKWIALSSSGSSGVGISEYKFMKIPNKGEYLTYSPDQQLIGELNDIFGSIGLSRPLVSLEGGRLGIIDYCLGLFNDGTYLFSVMVISETHIREYYWVAMRRSLTLPLNLVKVAELKCTEQFLDYWYNYTVDTGIDNKFKFVAYTPPYDGGNDLKTFSTELTLVGSVLTAVDTNIPFGGQTVNDLYLALTGHSIHSTYYYEPLYNANNDYCGMMLGRDMGWVYYTDANLINPFSTFVGYNVLTGDTVLVDALGDFASVTNFNLNISIPFLLERIVSHPKGLLFALNDGFECASGTSVTGVTGLWSPRWIHNTIAVRLNSRYIQDIGYSFIYSNIGGEINSPVSPVEVGNYACGQLDTNYCFCIQFSVGNQGYLCVYRFELDTPLALPSFNFKELPIRNVNIDNFIYQISIDFTDFPCNNGYAFLLSGNYPSDYGTVDLFYWNDANENPVLLQNNEWCITNFLGNKIYGNVFNADASATYLMVTCDTHSTESFS